MRTGLILAIAGLTCGFAPGTVGPIAATAAPAAVSTTASDVRVGTWNVNSVGAVLSRPDQRVWRKREPVIVRQIVRARLDVLGVQEVSQSLGYRGRLRNGNTQFRDLLASLNRTGMVRYSLTSNRRGASLNNRILYKPRKLRMLQQGALAYRHRAVTGSGANRHLRRPRGMVWAVFEVRSTGAQFLFVSTHLQPRNRSVRLDQLRELIKQIQQLQRGHTGRPTVAVGDYNMSICGAPQLNAAFRNAGMPNVLEGEACHKRLPVRAQSHHNIWIGSFNSYHRSLGFRRNCPAALRNDHGRTPCVGRNLDHIFASARLKVPYYEVVAAMNRKKTQLVGTIPSDHYLVMSTISIPK
jgi:endonuclease/exonuclease/phosphatase family metal-dependent hydrolase